MIMRKYILSIVLVSALQNSIAAEKTMDPIQNFKSQWEMAGVVKIYKLEADINNDGMAEVFLSTGKSDPPDEEDFGWQLYIAISESEYAVAPQKTETGENPNSIPGFAKERYRTGFIPEINKHGLLHLVRGRGGQAMCQLIAIVIDGEAWKEIPIGEPVSVEEHYEELAARFETPPTPAIQEIDP